ncbi:hypothetical protein CEXT_540541 [Caerostris extrusa]|uniref:Uncharacterized protein n=1 Tax=Caerostris extrusa TaxID=172846 RepID=A0AAV4NA50_CAEEX|nr:hypothetical protein CEXT_540541 [Caerostris extrusa]
MDQDQSIFFQPSTPGPDQLLRTTSSSSLPSSSSIFLTYFARARHFKEKSRVVDAQRENIQQNKPTTG